MTTRASNSAKHKALSHEEACRCLQYLPLAKPVDAEQELIRALDALLLAPPDPGDLFSLLEQIRGPLCFVREAAVRNYLGKAPHLDADEEAHFQRGIDSANLMLRSYLYCAGLEEADEPAGRAGKAPLAGETATVLQRCLHYSSMLIFEHYRAKRELPTGTWARHNRLFATAARRGIATLQVDDRIFDESRTSSCQAAFVTPLLVELARPYGRNAHDMNLIWRWAEQEAPEVEVQPLSNRSPAPAYAIELDQDAPLRPIKLIKGGRDTSQLKTAALTGHLRQILAKLAQGASPEHLGLCPENIEQSTRLLGQLATLWSLDTPQRREPRTPQGSHAQVCTGFHAMHHFLLGAESNAACLAQLKRLDGKESGPPPEAWEIIDQGPAGFRLAGPACGARLTNNQLLALRPDHASNFLLGQVSWLKREQSGRLIAGVAILPGIPQAVCVRPMPLIRGQKTSFVRAFLLHPGSGLPTRPSILIPADIRSSRRDPYEVLYDRHWQITLGDVIQTGSDFEQVAFTAI